MTVSKARPEPGCPLPYTRSGVELGKVKRQTPTTQRTRPMGISEGVAYAIPSPEEL